MFGHEVEMVWALGSWVKGYTLGLGVSLVGGRVSGVGCRVQGIGCRV